MATTSKTVASPIGHWTVEGDDDGITRIWMPSERLRATRGPVAKPVSRVAEQLAEYFAGRRRSFDADLHVEGTDFQVDVWLALTDIPYGEVRTYGEIASAVRRPHAYRAVGNANGKNPFPIVVPCHRVVASSGIGGYAGGLDIKRFLLALEGVTA